MISISILLKSFHLKFDRKLPTIQQNIFLIKYRRVHNTAVSSMSAVSDCFDSRSTTNNTNFN